MAPETSRWTSRAPSSGRLCQAPLPEENVPASPRRERVTGTLSPRVRSLLWTQGPGCRPQGKTSCTQRQPSALSAPDDPRRGRAGGVNTCFQGGTSSLQLPPAGRWLRLCSPGRCSTFQGPAQIPGQAPPCPICPPSARCLRGVPRAVPSRSPWGEATQPGQTVPRTARRPGLGRGALGTWERGAAGTPGQGH